MLRMSDLSRGYCNTVHLATVEGAGEGDGAGGATTTQLVVKLYSDLSTLRVPPEVRGVPDRLLAANEIAPSVVLSTDAGIVHEYVPGRVLSEADMHQPGAASEALMRAVAARLAQLHALPIPAPPFAGEPLVWRWMEAMLGAAAASGATVDYATPGQLQAEVDYLRAALASAGAPVVFAHGDCKPSNLMRRRGGEEASADEGGGAPSAVAKQDLVFIDLELAGPNYRGFDVMKLFRSDEHFSEENMRLFIREYMGTSAPDAGRSSLDTEVERVYVEARMFEPLTWLEAAIFFVLVLTTRKSSSEETERNYKLGKQRWERYLEAKSMIESFGERLEGLPR